MESARTAWWCPCGEHGLQRCVPASVRALTAHLIVTGHSYGEYFYGCAAQRTTVAVHHSEDGGLRHQVVWN